MDDAREDVAGQPGSVQREQANLLILFQAVQRFRMVLLEKGCLDLHVRFQDFAVAIGDLREAAAVYDRKIFPHEAAVFVCRERENLETELLGDEEYRIEDVVARRLAERVIRDDDARFLFRVRDSGALFRQVVQAAEEQRHVLAPDLSARPFVGFLPVVGAL